ncbi:MAG: DNA-binding response regulator [Pseudomonadota bacterium]|jgi:two-component system phosphate regulon response regulator OmpR
MNGSNRKLLIVDDDPKLRELLRRYLGENQFEVALAPDGPSMQRLLQREQYDMIILDLMLPGDDGLTLLRRLREHHDRTPVLMLTAKGDEIDRIIGLEVGADDYLAKPFNPRELLARIHAVLRRSPAAPAPGAPGSPGEDLSFGPFLLKLGTRQLLRDGQAVPLTSSEFSVLKVLAQHARTPLSRDKLMTLARGREYGAFDRSLDVQVSRLRRIIEEDPAQPRYLQTVWGVGYVFIPDEQ